MSTPAQPRRTAARVSSTESGNAQHPVPGIMRSGGRPASTRFSSSAIFSATQSEFASELVPNTASPRDAGRFGHRELHDRILHDRRSRFYRLASGIGGADA